MKICVISNLYPPLMRGGAELVAERIVNALVKQGHEVSVISTRKYTGRESFHFKLTENNPASVYRFFPANIYHILDDANQPLIKKIIWHKLDFLGFSAMLEVRKILKITKPDVVITHNLKGIGLSVPSVLKKLKIRHIHVLHDLQLIIPSGLLVFGEENNWMNNGLLQKFYCASARLRFGSPDAVISPSLYLLNEHKRRVFFKKSDLYVLPNPMPENALQQDELRKSEDASQGTLRLFFAGQLSAHKGLKFLIEALKDFEIPHELHIAGSGELKEFVEREARENPRIIYHGKFGFEELMRLNVNMHATIVPSMCYENSPNAIYESFSVGVPVIASRIGGVGELIVEGENGLLFDAGDADALRAALARFALERRAWLAKSEQIKNSFEKYSIENYIKKLIVILK